MQWPNITGELRRGVGYQPRSYVCCGPVMRCQWR